MKYVQLVCFLKHRIFIFNSKAWKCQEKSLKIMLSKQMTGRKSIVMDDMNPYTASN